MLSDPSLLKIFHFARFDLAMSQKYLGVRVAPVFCTRTASRLVRTNTDKHGLKDLCKELGVHTEPAQIEGVWIAPIYSWYHASFDREPDLRGAPAVEKVCLYLAFVALSSPMKG